MKALFLSALLMLCGCGRHVNHLLIAVVLCGACTMAGAAAPPLTPADMQLLKAVRTGDAAGVKSALAAGTRIRPDEGSFLEPVAVAVIFDQRSVLPLLVVDQGLADEAYAFSVMFKNVAAFESLLAIRQPSQPFIARGLRGFARRLSPVVTDAVKKSIDSVLTGGSGELADAPSFWEVLSPTHLESADAPELRIVKKLRELGSTPGPDDAEHPLRVAAEAGDVFFADWLDLLSLLL